MEKLRNTPKCKKQSRRSRCLYVLFVWIVIYGCVNKQSTTLYKVRKFDYSGNTKNFYSIEVKTKSVQEFIYYSDSFNSVVLKKDIPHIVLENKVSYRNIEFPYPQNDGTDTICFNSNKMKFKSFVLKKMDSPFTLKKQEILVKVLPIYNMPDIYPMLYIYDLDKLVFSRIYLQRAKYTLIEELN
jgi:hypothetical protein